MEPSRLHLLLGQDTCRPSNHFYQPPSCDFSCTQRRLHRLCHMRQEGNGCVQTHGRLAHHAVRWTWWAAGTLRAGAQLPGNGHVPIAQQTFHLSVISSDFGAQYCLCCACKRQKKLTIGQPSGRCPGLAAAAGHAGCNVPPASATKVKVCLIKRSSLSPAML